MIKTPRLQGSCERTASDLVSGPKSLPLSVDTQCARGAAHLPVGVAAHVSPEEAGCHTLADMRTKDAIRALFASGAPDVNIVPGRSGCLWHSEAPEMHVCNMEDLRVIMNMDACDSPGRLGPWTKPPRRVASGKLSGSC
jgi:hypothetical protein